MDPRFRHIDFLDQMLVSIKEVQAELNLIEDDQEKIFRAGKFAEEKTGDLFEIKELESNMKSSLSAITIFVVQAIMATIIGNVAWVALTQAFGRLVPIAAGGGG
jgi:hypothetical protein